MIVGEDPEQMDFSPELRYATLERLSTIDAFEQQVAFTKSFLYINLNSSQAQPSVTWPLGLVV